MRWVEQKLFTLLFPATVTVVVLSYCRTVAVTVEDADERGAGMAWILGGVRRPAGEYWRERAEIACREPGRSFFLGENPRRKLPCSLRVP